MTFNLDEGVPRPRAVLADAHAQDRRTLAFKLVDLGYEVVGAADGREAVAHALERIAALSLLVVSLELPVLGGIQVIQQVMRAARAPRSNASPLILALTTNSWSENSALSAGAHAVLAKPFTQSSFVMVIRGLLSVRGGVPGRGITQIRSL
jgi:CheY-like chemotaxis protein